MSSWYLDTSAALKLLIEVDESEALATAIDAAAPDVVGCWLLETELCLAAQRDTTLRQQAVSDFLNGVDLYEVPASLFREAGLLPGSSLRSLDALHLVAAVRIGVNHLVTYDSRMSDSARTLGSVIAPT